MKILKKTSLVATLGALLLGTLGAHAAGEGWLTNYDAAIAKAKEEGKFLLVEFHGSDWCPPCIKLNKEVLSTDAFKALAEKKLVLVDADFPRKTQLSPEQKAHNEALAGKFGVQYFPTVLIIDAEGKVLDKLVGFPEGGLEGFLKFINDKVAS
jgi:thioredoxin-related protein